MNNAATTSSAARDATTSSPRETLTGDRACTHCLHPLVGRTIEREPTTGLLYVRCGECGMATALMEYPSATPWLNRMKTVVASGLVATALAIVLLLAGASGGLATAAAMSASTASADSVYRAFAEAHPQHDDPNAQGSWNAADSAWLASDAGQAALAGSRWSLEALLPFATFVFLGGLVVFPFTLFLGLAALRRPLLQRALVGMMPVLTGCLLIAGPSRLLAMQGRLAVNWQDAAVHANHAHFAILGTTVLCGIAALTAILAPSLAAAAFRAILPPRDRRLVAWIWEWRGLPVPTQP